MTAGRQNTKTIEVEELPEFIARPDLYGNESPLYRATHAIVNDFAAQLSPQASVLEIGCGAWDYCKRKCESNGAQWYGVDPLVSEKNKEVVATHRGSVHDMPFPDAKFDFVIGNQTIEHWHEFGVSFSEALAEIWRVLKPGGVVILNAPIHLHGHKIFLLNDRPRIESLFDEHSWSDIEIQEWRYHGAEPYYGWKRCRFSAQVFPALEGQCSYVLNVLARKHGQAPNAHVSLFQRIKRQCIQLSRITKLSRLAIYHLHYGPRHCVDKLNRGIQNSSHRRQRPHEY